MASAALVSAPATASAPRGRIGIIVRQQNYYSNGAGQNAIFLKFPLEKLGYAVDFLVYGLDATKPQTVHSPVLPYAYVNYASIDPTTYVRIVLGTATLPEAELARLRAAKIPVTMFNPCNPFDQFHNDNFVYPCKETSQIFEMQFRKIADDVWMTGNHVKPALGYLRVLNRNAIPIHPVPLIWSPAFLYKDGVVPQYSPPPAGSKTLDIVILEPSLNYCKSAWLPLMIAEALHLRDPSVIRNVYVFGAPDRKGPAGMISALKVAEDGRVRRFARLPINEIFSFFATAKSRGGDCHVVFLAHQIHLEMNYAYYDILYAGFPFVHNSTYLHDRGLGLFYPDSDVDKGADAVLAACLQDVDAARAAGRAFADEFHPEGAASVAAFRDLLADAVLAEARSKK